MHALLERYFPERRVFLRSDTDTRFIRLRPATQLIAFAGSSAVIAWAIIATAILIMDSIGSGNFREQAKRDQQTYEYRLNALSAERDKRAEEAIAAQSRFNSALEQISVMQSELLASETRRREMETGVDVIQTTLRKVMNERDDARTEAVVLAENLANTDGAQGGVVWRAAGKQGQRQGRQALHEFVRILCVVGGDGRGCYWQAATAGQKPGTMTGGGHSGLYLVGE